MVVAVVVVVVVVAGGYYGEAVGGGGGGGVVGGGGDEGVAAVVVVVVVVGDGGGDEALADEVFRWPGAEVIAATGSEPHRQHPRALPLIHEALQSLDFLLLLTALARLEDKVQIALGLGPRLSEM